MCSPVNSNHTAGFIWDEASQIHKFWIDAVDRMLRDVCDNPNVPFAGKMFLFSGDWAQLLPVHPFCVDTVRYSLKTTSWWTGTRTLSLTTNMRACSDPAYADFLMHIATHAGPVQVPAQCMVSSLDELVAKVWAGGNYTGNRAILCCLCEEARDINRLVLSKLPGLDEISVSMDEAWDCDRSLFPIEFLNSVNVDGMPEHKLLLKKGAPYMIIRNMNEKILNGTRVEFIRRLRNFIEVRILTGAYQGETVTLPRIQFVSRTPRLPFALRRRQYPLIPAFAFSVHKSQVSLHDT